MSQPLLIVKQICKSFKQQGHQDLLVLDNIELTLYPGEIIALLGPSGSGKSTLLRIIAGLARPLSGEIIFNGQPLLGPNNRIAMVFQQFALMPWLTVQQNVELGLEAMGVPYQERSQRALSAIDTVGLDGFESAYPRELSGGMCQRVGLARALVVKPDLLLMDEPFSALDVLTSENLRNDVIDLWETGKTTRSILLVTHDIEEAVIMADRIIIFDANPGRIRQQIQVELDRPRDVDSPQVKRLVNQLYSLMTHKLEQELPAKEITPPAVQQQPQQAIDYRLPDIEVAQLTGVLETLVDDGITSIALAELANETHMSLDELIPLIESLELLGFAHTHGSQLSILPLGKRFAQADILDRKTLFGRQLQKNVPLANYIVSRLNFSAQKQVASEVFLEELSYYFSDEEAERVFRDVVDWGRYAELFEYDDKRELVLLPEA